MEEASHPPWEASFWENFFSKKRHPPNGPSQIDSCVNIKHPATLQLKNVYINNYVISAELPLDEFHCAHLGKDMVIQKGKETYMGNFKGRNLNGVGKIISQQLVYEGHIRNGEKWGQGKSTFFFRPSAAHAKSSVVVYKGEWKGNKRNGYGVLLIRKCVNEPSVKTYEGWWRQNERHFYGVQRHANAVYCGFWVRNKKCGFGKMCWFAKGGDVKRGNSPPCDDITSEKSPPEEGNKPKKVIQNVYVGEWENDQMHGYGTYFWFVRQGNKKKSAYQSERYHKHEGYWQRGERNGFGMFHHRCGDTYWGFWKKNKKHGLGYLLKLNGTVCKCNYLNGEITSQVELNQTYKMNHLYTNSICELVNLGTLLQEDSNLTHRHIKHFYKIVYDHFDLLIKAYRFYWRNGWGGDHIYEGRRREEDNSSIRKEEGVHPVGSFKLKNLWHMFYDANIIHSSFPLSSLNWLVKDDMSLGDNINLANLLGDNYKWVGEDTLLNEEEMVKRFFQSSHLLTEPFLFTRATGVHKEEATNEGSHNPNVNQVSFGEGTRSSARNSHMDGKNCGMIDIPGEAVHPVSTPTYDTHNPMAHILFNKDLFLVKCLKNFYKNQWKEQRCYHMNEAKRVLKKICLFLFTNKGRHDNGYLFYVLFSVFHSAFPLWYALARMSEAWTVGRTGWAKGNGNSGNHPTGDPNQSAHLNKHLAVLNLARYNIHDESRKISFNSFVYTLVRVSLHLRDVRGEHQTRVMVNLLNALKGCVEGMDTEKHHPQSGNIAAGLKKRHMRTKRNRNKCGKKGEEEKWAVNGRHVSAENRENGVCPTKYTHPARCQGFGPGPTGEARQRTGNFHGVGKKKKVKKVQNHANAAKRVKALPSCAICCHRGAPPIKPNEKKKNGSPRRGKEDLTALVNILDNFVYYFILYFLLFNSTEKRFSLLSTKLNVSLRLGDVLKFLLQLKITRKAETTRGKAKSINLGPHDHYDDYHTHGRGETKIKAKRWKPLHILNSADKREEKEGTTVIKRQTNNNHYKEEEHTKLTSKRNSYIAHTASHLQEKIDKYRLQNNAVRYIVLLNEQEKKIMNKFATCAKQKCYSEELLPKRENGETKEKAPCPVHTEGYKNKLVNELSEQVKQLEVENFEQVANDSPPCVQNEKEKKRNKRGRRKDEKKVPERIISDVEECPQVMSHEGGHEHVRIKRRRQVGVALYRLRKRFAHSRKNYMNVLDYYNTCITPYELGLFFLRFVRVVKRKRGINGSYSDVLFFFVFHVLLRKTFRLARQAGAHP
ncbi:hypothetical protein AK88_03187 [Plasmodium fragile]|uniref:MORN repeat protein n=1 Tax=Plasmodium fragile TaxID=5857 RepID=A0A0D9QJB8_PLAFR|nr:uncharacterized protein AK88_03187 [Plasmodium fragile]KJP87140.1 hypothetical protein AK88_03187 [Plasmodium fragile]